MRHPNPGARALRTPAIRAAVLALLLPTLTPAGAVTATWVGGAAVAPTSWANPLNWQPQQLPVSASNTVLLFPNSFVASVNDIGNNFQFNQISAFAGGGGAATGTILGQSLAPSGTGAQIGVGSGGTLVLNAALVGAGAWTKTGGGDLVLGGANIGASGEITVAAGATLRSGGTQLFGGIAGAGTWQADGSVTLTNASGERRFDGGVSGTAALQKTGSGRQVFTGNVALLGAVTAGGGELVLSGPSARWTGSSAVTVANAGLATLAGGAQWTTLGQLNVGSGTSAGVTSTLSLSGGSTFSSVSSSIGRQQGERGQVTLDGASHWSSAGDLALGAQGIGRADLLNGSSASAQQASLGASLGAVGTLVLASGSSASFSQLLTAGGAGRGSVSVGEDAILTSGATTLGAQVTGLGTVSVSGANSRWTAGTLTVGADGQGTVTSSRGTLSTGATTLAVAATALGSAALADASTWTVGGTLLVGNAGTGGVTLDGGSVLTSDAATLGLLQGSSGSVVLRGGSSWTNQGPLAVGSIGKGAVEVRSSSLVSGATTVGLVRESGASPRASTVLLDSGSWTVGGALAVADGGVAIVTVGSGSTLVSSGADLARRLGADGTVQVGGGTAGTSWVNTGNLVVGRGGIGAVNLTGLATLTTGKTSLGLDQGSNSALALAGDGNGLPTATVNGELNVGYDGAGTLTITGGSLSSAAAYIGRGTAGRGSATVQAGPGASFARWSIDGDLSVGSADVGRIGGLLVVGSNTSVGEVVASGALGIQPNGQVSLRRGLLSVASIAPDVGGRLDWTGGTLEISGPDGATLGSTSYLGSVLALRGDQTLAVTHTLQVGTGTLVLLDQAQVRAGRLELAGGQIVGTSEMNLAGTKVVGKGVITNKVFSADTSTVVEASGGTLTIGNANETAGFNNAGTAKVGDGARLVLAAASVLPLGKTTEIGPGGTLQTLRGALLLPGGTLTGSAGSVVVGSLNNLGAVQGPSTGTLTFNDNVTGNGSYTGQVRFNQQFAPTAGARAEQLSLAPSAILTLLQVWPLHVSGLAELDGTLDLAFGNGFQPVEGATSVLVSWGSHSGSFDSFVFSGLDPAWTAQLRYDADALRVVVRAVPEPGVWLLMLVGTALLLARRRA